MNKKLPVAKNIINGKNWEDLFAKLHDKSDANK